jgi:hypothetical protein
MSAIRTCELPRQSLLRQYLRDGAYTDCYATDLPTPVSHATYVEAFYTTAVFKIERLLLRWFVSRPSTDLQARELAAGSLGAFAAWKVEGRERDQLLLADFTGRTRSWLMTAAAEHGGTRLYFGSAVLPAGRGAAGETRLGPVFSSLLGFHKLYSRTLLLAARLRLGRGASPRR